LVEVGEAASVIFDGLQLIMPMLSVLWLWYERRAPHYRLVLWPR
jgi:hypothetical protein